MMKKIGNVDWMLSAEGIMVSDKLGTEIDSPGPQ